MEDENPPTQEPQITFTVPHDAAVAIGVAAIHYGVLLTGSAEDASTIRHLDQVYRQVMQHPQVSLVAKEVLRDMRLVIAEQRE